VIQSDSGLSRAPAVSADFESVPDLVEAAARKYEMDPLLVHSVIQVESGYNPYAVSPKGAQGLMQLMPGTARRFGVSNTFNPRENIEGGVRYLKYLTTLFPNDPRLALAAYNAGEGAVWKYNYRIPPYRETEQYIYKVARKYGQARRQAQQSRPVETATAVKEVPAPSGPVYSPVQYYVDTEGRLHMRTVAAEAVTAGTP
jgi:soluble lytic murein transglycosylase-like protein